MSEAKERLPEAQVVEKIYQQPKKFYALLIPSVIFVFLFSLFINYPVTENLKILIQGQLAKNKSCPISYVDLDFGLFLPKIIFNDVTVPGRCFNKNNMALDLSQLQLNLSMPTIWPLGIKTRVEAKGDGLNLNVYPRIAIGGNAIQIENTTVEGKFINPFLPFPNLLSGTLAIQGNFDLNGQNIKRGSIKVSSQNLLIPPQNIMGIALSQMNFKKLEIAGTYLIKAMNFKAIRLGEKDSPIIAEFKGKITPNQMNMNMSQLNLEGRVKFSDTFLSEISLLRIMLKSKKQKEGYFYLRIGGTLAAPQPTFVDPS